VSFDFNNGTVFATASGVDDSGDDVLYTFRVYRGEEEYVAGPQLENTARIEVGFGPWTVSVVVDDDVSCDDAAEDSRCSLEVYVPHIDFLMHARGDVDGNGRQDVTDAVRILAFLFRGSSPPSCLAAADVNTDATVDVSDGIALLVFLFLDGEVPAFPFLSCGFSGNESDFLLGCDPVGCA
jgi:hypothetical protein